ncbi:reverse transcriptase domain-containing protein [Tanacetum coccineum]
MADNRTMAQMLQAPIEGYEDAIVVPPINANNFELEQPLINLVQSNKFTGRQDPHNHLRFFNKVTSTFRHPEVPNTSIKLLLFPFSLDGEARDWLDKEPPRSILTWDDLVSKFINQFFPPSKTTYLRNEITTFYQKPNETFNEAWEHFKGLLRQCPHHGFSELHQLDTFYNSLNTNDQDALDSAAGGNFLDKMPRDGLSIIESKSKVRYSRSRPNDSRAITNAPSSTSLPSNNSFEIQQMAALFEDKMNIRMSRLEKAISEKNATTPATVKSVEEVCVTCGFNANYHNNSTASTSRSSTLPSQTVTNPREQINAITTRSGKTCEGPSTPLVPTPVVSTPSKEPKLNPETSTEKVQNPNLENTAHVLPPEEEDSIFIEIPKPKAKKTVNVEIQDLNSPRPNSYQSRLPYPERMKVRENNKPSAQHSRFLKMFKQLRLEIRLKDALVEMPKFNKWLSSLLRNKEKLKEIAITTVNAECSAIIINKVPEKLKDPGKFLIPCALQELDRTSALADSRASINLLPHSIYKKLRLEALTPTRMTLELANHSISYPMGIAKDVVVRVDGFTFHADFVVANFEPDPRVPIILGRPFLRTAKALIDLYEEKLTLRVGKDKLVYYAEKSKKKKDKHFVHAISVIDFSKGDPFSGSTTTHSDDPSPSSSPVKTSDNFEKFADELAPLDSLPPGNDDSTLKKDLHEENFQVYSNPLFEFDDNFKSSTINPLFDDMEEDVEIKILTFLMNQFLMEEETTRNDGLRWLETENRQLMHYSLNIEDHDHPIITTISIPQRGMTFLKSYGYMDPMQILIQMYHLLHLEQKLFEWRGSLFLVCLDDFGYREFTIYKMTIGCSVWMVRYLVHTDDFMTPLPEGWSIQSNVWRIVLGEREQDSFLVIKLSGKVVQYNLISKTLHEIYDCGSNQVDDNYDDNDDADNDDDELLQQF